jgi:hypothetical protein
MKRSIQTFGVEGMENPITRGQEQWILVRLSKPGPSAIKIMSCLERRDERRKGAEPEEFL